MILLRVVDPCLYLVPIYLNFVLIKPLISLVNTKTTNFRLFFLSTVLETIVEKLFYKWLKIILILPNQDILIIIKVKAHCIMAFLNQNAFRQDVGAFL